MNTLSQHFSAKIKSFDRLNDELTICRCYVMGLGKNRNLSYFSREDVEKNISTIFNIPVIGHLREDDEGNLYMGGHDMELVQTEKGYAFKSLCVPFGVVPEQDSLSYEKVQEPNGNIVEYLVADVILWTGRYPELRDAIYSDDIYFNQSMEIKFGDSQPLDDDPNYQHITDFTFSALCMLGKDDDVSSERHTEPCFPASRIEAYQFAQTTEFSDLMDQFKFALSECTRVQNEGGEDKTMPMSKEKISEIFAEFGIEPEAFAFQITDDTTEDDLRNAIAEFVAANSDNAHVDDPVADPEALFSVTYEQRRQAICVVLQPEVVRDSEGCLVSETNYYLEDFDDNYAYVSQYIWTRDNYEHQVGRFTYSIEDSSESATITGDFEKMYVQWLTEEENTKLARSREEFEALVQFKQERLQADHDAAVDAVLEQFSDLSQIQDYVDFAATAHDIESIDEIETRCHVIRSKHFKLNNSPAPTNTVKVPVAPAGTHSDVYGGIFALYGYKPETRKDDK